MGIEHADRDPHWNYFLALEEDVGRLSRWIEFSKENEQTYSIELARLLMTAAAEADVIAKQICQRLVPGTKASSIGSYQPIILAAYPGLPKARVHMPKFGMIFTPWEEWSKPDSPPIWWTANNKVKHHRQTSFRDASLKNVLNATAGLLLLLAISYDRIAKAVAPAPTLLRPKAFAFVHANELRILWSEQ